MEETTPPEPTAAQKRQEKIQNAADTIKKRAQASTKKTAAKKTAVKKTAAPTTPPTGEAPAASSAPRSARRPVAGPGARRAAPPAEQAKTTFYSERINLTTTPAQKKMLKLAGVEDGIDTTARIRAMIALYEEDERLRKRVDKTAQHWR